MQEDKFEERFWNMDEGVESKQETQAWGQRFRVEWGGDTPSCACRALEDSVLGFEASVSDCSPQARTAGRHQKEQGVKADGLQVVDGMMECSGTR